ncbi:hypothetical protein [Paenibacillus odorifer]|uniref:hypothetical protein n=1 Tax=Paenibacillus odorifer TaxID=189426 RepID=UPI0011157D65|nr:hypothetical protein [Paenibacillus odorifer]
MLRLCIHHAARPSDSDDAIGVYFAFGACFRTPETLLLSNGGISALESVGMGNIGKCCVKGQLCPLETTGWRLAAVIFAHRHVTSGSPVIGESLLFVLADGWLLRLCIHHAARLADSADVIGVYFAFGACFRTPETLLLGKRLILCVFKVNSCAGVRWYGKYREMLR